jgi:RNA polymerase sigma factor (sigma-70 family)
VEDRDYEVLVQGNILAKTWARRILGRRKLGRFLTVLLNPCRAESFGLTEAQVEAILAIPQEDQEAIKATQGITAKLFEEFQRLSVRIARRYAAGTGHSSLADIADLESEASVGLLKAIRGYSSTETKFVTYAHKTINNEVSRYLQESGIIRGHQPLLVRYKRKLEELIKSGLPHTFEDVCLALSLTEGQVSRLQDTLAAEVTSESEMEEALGNLLIAKPDDRVDQELIDRLGIPSLSMLEKHAWYTHDEARGLFPEIHCDCCDCRERAQEDPDFKGEKFETLKDVAQHFGVTPQAASEAVKRARKKLAKHLGDWK